MRRKSPAAAGPDITLTIDELAGGGDGVGHHEDRAVFVPDTAPGDRVRVRVQQRRRSWWRGILLEVLQPGPARQEPTCPVSLLCGGCQWHHVRYEHQLTAKIGLLQRAFRQARVHAPAVDARAAPDALGYRCRARLHWYPAPGGTVLGFLGRRSHKVVDVSQCAVLLPQLSAQLSELRRALAHTPHPGELLLLGNERDHWGAERLDGGEPRCWGAREIDQAADSEPSFWTTPETFFQANPAVNRQLRSLVAQWAAQDSEAAEPLCVELFAGSGNLTRGLTQRGPVIAVESQPAAVALGRRNLEGLDIEWMTADAGEALDQLSARDLAPDLVVLDPPRAGARALLDGLIRLGPRRVLYVSCDPMTLARDVAHLAGAGYQLRRLSLLDTMPQTHHFETVAELKRT